MSSAAMENEASQHIWRYLFESGTDALLDKDEVRIGKFAEWNKDTYVSLDTSFFGRLLGPLCGSDDIRVDPNSRSRSPQARSHGPSFYLLQTRRRRCL